MRTVIQILAAFAAVALSSCASPERGESRVCEIADGCAYRSVVQNGPKPRRVAFEYARDWAGANAPCVAVHVIGRHRAEAIAYRETSGEPLRLD